MYKNNVTIDYNCTIGWHIVYYDKIIRVKANRQRTKYMEAKVLLSKLRKNEIKM